MANVNRTGRSGLAAAVALAAFTAGVLVYMVDRPPRTAYLLPAAWTLPAGASLFGVLGGSLPSFAHALAFSVGTALLPGWRRPGAACLLWGGIDAALELGQLPAVARVVVPALPAWFEQWPVLDHLGSSLLQGRFDPWDLVAVATGCAVAYGLLRSRDKDRARGGDR